MRTNSISISESSSLNDDEDDDDDDEEDDYVADGMIFPMFRSYHIKTYSSQKLLYNFDEFLQAKA